MSLDSEFWKALTVALALSSTAIILFVAVTHCVARRPMFRKSIWQAGFVGLLVLLLVELTGTGGGLIVQLLPMESVTTALVPDSPKALTPQSGQLPMDVRPVKIEPTPLSIEPMPAANLFPGILWAVVALLLIARIFIRQFALFRFRRGSQPVNNDGLLKRVGMIAGELGIRARIHVIESSRLQTPIAFGVLHPTIGLPSNFARNFSAAEQDAMFAHELGHHAANDPRWRLFVDVVNALWWWHPLVWWARRKWIQQSELAADEASELIEGGATRLAECLVRFGRQLAQPKAAGWLGMAGEGYRSHLGKRVKTLLDNNRTPLRRQRTWLSIPITLCAFLILMAAGLSVTAIANPRMVFPDDTASQKVTDAFNDSLVGRTVWQIASREQAEETVAIPAHAVPEPHLSEPNNREPIVASETTVQSLPKPPALLAQAPVVPPPVEEVMPGTNSSPPVEASAMPEPAEQLFTRSFKVEPNHLKAELERFVDTMGIELPQPGEEPEVTEETKSTGGFMPKTQPLKHNDAPLHILRNQSQLDQKQAMVALDSYFESIGVKFEAPKMFYFNDLTGMILVRATLQDLEIIRTAIRTLNEAPTQVTIESRWVEITAEEGRALGFDWFVGETSDHEKNKITRPDADETGNTATVETPPEPPPPSAVGILTEPQFRIVMQALEQRQGVDIMFAPRVTTLSGRQTQIKTVEIQTIVTDVNTNESGLFPVTEAQEFGPVLDVIPHVSADDSRIDMTVITTLTQFVGYNDPGDERVVYQPDKDEPADELPVPLPRYRLRQAATTVSVQSGQTLVIGGMTQDVDVVTKHKVPVLGSVPLLGRLFRSQKVSQEKKHLIVFITPTAIDPAGNRITLEARTKNTDTDRPGTTP